jgi:hypothetical protein
LIGNGNSFLIFTLHIFLMPHCGLIKHPDLFLKYLIFIFNTKSDFATLLFKYPVVS